MSDETYDDGAIEPAPKDDNEGPTVRHPDAVGDDPVEDSGDDVAEDETATEPEGDVVVEPEPEAPAEVPAGDADPEAEAAAAEEPDEE